MPVHLGLGEGGDLTLFLNNEKVDLQDSGLRRSALAGGVQ